MGIFGFFRKLFKVDDEYGFEYDFELEQDSMDEVLQRDTLRRADLDVHNYKERERYIRACCEQMVDASNEVDIAKREYQIVTDYLTDMEEIEGLPPAEREEIEQAARKITLIEKENANYKRPATKITESQYHRMESMEDEVPKAIAKLKVDEEQQMAIRKDLHLLEGEKGTLAYTVRDSRRTKSNAKSLAIIIVFSVWLAVVLLTIMQFMADMEMRTGYLVTIGIAAIAITFSFTQFRNAQQGQEKAEKMLNRAILLQNKVKIKYVNITNVLDYNYSKYNIDNVYELEYMWEKYLEEKEAREHSEKILAKMDATGRELCKILRQYRVKDPMIWIHQAEALLNPKEMIEIRHSLIIQRQRLRKRIDFNNFNMESAKEEMEDLVKNYPKYAKEILAIVSQYE